MGAVLGGTTVVLDPLGRVLVGAAAGLLLALAVRDRLLRPRLAAGPDGVVVRRLSGATVLPWARLRVQVRESRRWGLRSRLLELDTAADPDDDGDLVLLGRRDLGADPGDVARALRDLRPG
ncbi:MAG TPA: PH domain-containing protein [Geodermatophilus sp.]|nr:PH domain-containing protein [Geodermatophilus sp.]